MQWFCRILFLAVITSPSLPRLTGSVFLPFMSRYVCADGSMPCVWNTASPKAYTAMWLLIRLGYALRCTIDTWTLVILSQPFWPGECRRGCLMRIGWWTTNRPTYKFPQIITRDWRFHGQHRMQPIAHGDKKTIFFNIITYWVDQYHKSSRATQA